jgi:hypothetical protein
VVVSRASEFQKRTHSSNETYTNSQRVRRVKCDEKRPGCDRCKKFGRECDGYTTQRSSSRRESLIPIQPRPDYLQVYAPAFSVPGDETERRYFQIFCDRTAHDLAGYFPTSFWQRGVLQESHSDSSVRHAVIALGALTKTLDSSLGVNVFETSNDATEHHEYALSQYNKAIVYLRQTLAKGNPSIRTALVACLLFICFENFHGDHDAANSHVLCGLGLLDQWLAQNLPADMSAAGKRAQLQDLHQDEVFRIFSRIDSQSYAHTCASASVSLNPAPKLLLWESVSDTGIDVPFVFVELSEARSCWDYLMQRAITFHRMNEPYVAPNSPRIGTLNPRPSFLNDERNSIIIQLQQFEDALWPIMNADPDPLGLGIQTPGPTVLYLNNKIAIMNLHAAGADTIDESYWDSFLAEYEEIVARSLQLVDSTKHIATTHAGVFGFEIGIIAPLHLTAMKCRIPHIRRQAINILLSVPMREGCWDGVLLGKLDAWLMGLEEEGADAFGLVPEEQRWKLENVQSSTQERWIVGRAVRAGLLGDVESRETKITW